MSTWGGFRRRGRTLTAGLLAFWRPGGRDGGCPGTLSPIWADGAVRDSADGGADGNHHHASGAHGGGHAGQGVRTAQHHVRRVPAFGHGHLWPLADVVSLCGGSWQGRGAPSSRPRLRWAPTTGCGRCEPIETGPSCLGRPGLYWRTLCFRNRTQAHWGWLQGLLRGLRTPGCQAVPPRTSGARPQIRIASWMSSFVYRPDREEVRLLARSFGAGRRRPGPPEKKWASSSTSAGAGRGVIRRTAEVTLGAGIKQEGETSKSSPGRCGTGRRRRRPRNPVSQAGRRYAGPPLAES